MAMDAPNTTVMAMASPRSLVCHYNPSLVVAALVVSLLGAFTSTQLMSQARGARTLPGVLIWAVLGCLTFGFCATWCLHFLGMLSCEFDVPIGLNLPLTVLSAVLAVTFTFGALSTDLFQKYRRRRNRRRLDIERRQSTVIDHHLGADLEFRQSSEPLLRPSLELPNTRTRKDVARTTANGQPQSTEVDHIQDTASSTHALLTNIGASSLSSQRIEGLRMMLPFSDANQSDYDDAHSDGSRSTSGSQSRLSVDNPHLRADTTGINSPRSNSVHEPSITPPSNTLLFAAQAILNGLTLVNVAKGFVWSIALTNMHFMGVKALNIPGGFVALNPARVILCALISWSVCCVGVILMAGMEVNIKQQVLFSVVAATGVAAVHFSG
jgi:NO-binding membrane sensor protein with MHYT domain